MLDPYAEEPFLKVIRDELIEREVLSAAEIDNYLLDNADQIWEEHLLPVLDKIEQEASRADDEDLAEVMDDFYDL